VVRESTSFPRSNQVAADRGLPPCRPALGSRRQGIAADRLQLAARKVSEARQPVNGGVAGNIEVINAQSSTAPRVTRTSDARFPAVTARIALAVGWAARRTLH